jgi:hypothetical protein
MSDNAVRSGLVIRDYGTVSAKWLLADFKVGGQFSSAPERNSLVD